MARGSESDLIAEFERLVREEHPRLRVLASRVLGDPGDVEDALQEAYLKAFGAYPEARQHPTGSLQGWLYRIVYRCAIDQTRRRAGRRTSTLDPTFSSAPFADESDSAIDLERAFNRLSPETRAAVTLVDVLGFDYQAAADALDTNRGTIASRLHTARAVIRKHLDANPLHGAAKK
jgi:RNA polymerase sigma-70 factor (ECF subfamily)